MRSVLTHRNTWLSSAGILLLMALLAAPMASSHHEDDGLDGDGVLHRPDPDAARIQHDAATAGMVSSSGPFADVIKNLTTSSRGERLLPNATTDVWALDGFAYIGTFNTPCGDGTGANGSGIRIFDVHNHNKVTPAGFIPSVAGSRINDVKVANLNSGRILVHSNEPCAGGPGGFEVYDVNDPRNPVHLTHVQVDDSNATLRSAFGVVDVGVHNLFLFTQGSRDYVALQAEGFFGSLQIYELTNPAAPTFVSAWGAENLCTLPFCSTDPQNETDPSILVNTINGWLLTGFGSSQNRLLHDVTVSAEGTLAYLSNWDAGLVLLDVSDPTNPRLVSVADPTAGPGGEGNSHAAWPTADGKVVVETTEDFDFGKLAITVNSGPLGAGTQFGGTEDVGGAPPPRFSETGTVTGELVYVGRLCPGDPVENSAVFDPGDIAVIRRGVCTFSSKILNAQALGAGAAVIANNAPGGPAIGNWTAPDPAITIPGLFISTAAGDAIQASPTGNIATIDPAVFTELTPWGFVRIWDYSNPAAPVLASVFNTTNSLNENGPPDPRGTYSVHNVIVEGTKAYFSWYSDGVLILDISDPYHPVEVARYHREGPEFEVQNSGIQNFWGIYKIPGQPWLYASDRNGGLYVLKEYGSGSAKRGKP